MKITKRQLRKIISENTSLSGDRWIGLYADMSLTASIKSNMLKLIEQVADEAMDDDFDDEDALVASHDAFCSLVSEIADAAGYNHIAVQMNEFQRK